MNEKRFIRNIVGDIYDSEKDKWFEEDWKGKPLDYDDDLIVFLNELSKEVRRLKKYCNSYKGIISQKNDRIKSLELKNNRLNAKIDFLEKIIDGDL